MKSEEQKQRLEKWQKIIEEYQKSGMTQKAFCEQHNLSLPQLVYYHGQFKREKEAPIQKPAFVPVKIPSHEKSAITNEIRIMLPNGFQCLFPSNTDVVQIKRLMEILLSC